LADVKLDPDQVLGAFPHELSGGMCQRVMIAMALSCGAQLILADEPTTALDVSLQKDVLVLLRELVDKRGISVVFVSHDLGVLSEVCDRVMVMYRGEVKEVAPTREILARPAHPYSQALLSCVPRMNDQRLEEFPEIVSDNPKWVGAGGCNFLPRCPLGDDKCTAHPTLEPLDSDKSHLVRCWRPAGVAFATIPVRSSSLPVTAS
jgi:peptide/nickel transport system ATP-binding protein